MHDPPFGHHEPDACCGPERSRILDLLVSPQIDRGPMGIAQDAKALVADAREGMLDCPGRGTKLPFEHRALAFLGFGHPPLAPERHMVGGVDELGLRARQKVYVVREELRDAKALEPVSGEALVEAA